jgi:CO/xanthine dehydrogenase FAD-binding subunit
LNGIRQSGYTLEIGATATLQQVWENPSTPAALRQTLEKETSLNLRNASTLAGSLVSAEGRSPLATMLLALDARLSLESASGALQMGLAEYWALRPAGIITLVSLPLNAQATYEQVSRTPADFPLVAAALAQWGSGRTRLALGGWGSLPTLVMDGTEPEGLQETARAACSEAQDQWASAAYRMDVAATLAGRCLANLQGGKTE